MKQKKFADEFYKLMGKVKEKDLSFVHDFLLAEAVHTACMMAPDNQEGVRYTLNNLAEVSKMFGIQLVMNQKPTLH